MTESATAVESTDEMLARKDAEFAAWIETTYDFMIVKFAREFIELRTDGSRMDAALCKRLQQLQAQLMGRGE